MAGLLLAVAMPSMANAGQYFVYAGSYTSEPSSGTPPRVNPGRPAPQPSTSQGIYRSFVNGALEKEASIAYVPQGPGHSSVGMRINHVSYFKGAVMRAHFAPRALAPSEFMKVPVSLAGGQ